MENKPFNLQQIKSFFNPLNILEGKLNVLESKYNEFIQLKERYLEESAHKDAKPQLRSLKKQIELINDILIEINQNNLESFIEFQDILIEKYKLIHINRLKQLEVNPSHIRKIGLSLIENKDTAKILKKASYISSIKLDQWLEMTDYLEDNSLFISILDDINIFYNKIIDNKLEKELIKIPDYIDKSVLEEFKEAFRENPQLTFDSFIRELEEERIKKKLKEKTESIQKAKEKGMLEDLKRKQEEQNKLYKEYLKYSDKEFERRRRKQKRENLSEIAQKPEIKKEIGEDVEQKIKKFKSKFENSFEDKYLIQKDDSLDPKNIIRDRKKKKTEEYKEFLKKFKDNKSKDQ
ncbi:MAG: hypothetical protein ACQERB_12590 [Promethearchaeati archaeon]